MLSVYFNGRNIVSKIAKSVYQATKKSAYSVCGLSFYRE